MEYFPIFHRTFVMFNGTKLEWGMKMKNRERLELITFKTLLNPPHSRVLSYLSDLGCLKGEDKNK